VHKSDSPHRLLRDKVPYEQVL